MVFHSEGTTYTELKTRLFRLEINLGGQEHRLMDRMVSDRVGDINGWIMQRNLDFSSKDNRNSLEIIINVCFKYSRKSKFGDGQEYLYI